VVQTFLDQLRSSDILRSGGNRWAVEDPSDGAVWVPRRKEFNNLTTCFATSCYPCSKEQIVDLLLEGVNSKMMDEIRPIIEVSEW
jgi:hypothetical protein